eukprot:PhM_4_TR7343/c0_g1_i1/m.83031
MPVRPIGSLHPAPFGHVLDGRKRTNKGAVADFMTWEDEARAAMMALEALSWSEINSRVRLVTAYEAQTERFSRKVVAPLVEVMKAREMAATHRRLRNAIARQAYEEQLRDLRGLYVARREADANNLAAVRAAWMLEEADRSAHDAVYPFHVYLQRAADPTCREQHRIVSADEAKLLAPALSPRPSYAQASPQQLGEQYRRNVIAAITDEFPNAYDEREVLERVAATMYDMKSPLNLAPGYYLMLREHILSEQSATNSHSNKQRARPSRPAHALTNVDIPSSFPPATVFHSGQQLHSPLPPYEYRY